MAYSKSGPQNEILKLRDEITHEVNTDAEHIARSVFGTRGQQPDMQRVDDETLEARYRQAYTTQDRTWLIAEAQRDPEQFVKVARRIGVLLPDEQEQMFAQAAPVAPPPPPIVPPPQPELVPPPLPTPAAPAPGLPLPGAVAQPGQPVPLTVPAPGV